MMRLSRLISSSRNIIKLLHGKQVMARSIRFTGHDGHSGGQSGDQNSMFYRPIALSLAAAITSSNIGDDKIMVKNEKPDDATQAKQFNYKQSSSVANVIKRASGAIVSIQ